MSPRSGARSHVRSIRTGARFTPYFSDRSLDTLERTLDQLGPIFDRLLQPQGFDLHHLDQPGGALVVGNHSGGTNAMLEPLLLAHVARRAVHLSHLPHLLLHEILWHTPLAPTLRRLGAVPASPENADALLRGQRTTLVYPGGDREPFRPFWRRDTIELGDRRGYIKLALRHGVPVVPVVTAGMQSGFVSFTDGHTMARRLPLARSLRVGVLPITLSFPLGLALGAPPFHLPLSGRVKIRALPPIRFARWGAEAAADEAYVEACHRVVDDAMQAALYALADERRSERRAALHGHIDRWLPRFVTRSAHRALDATLERFERWTLAPRPDLLRPSASPPQPMPAAA